MTAWEITNVLVALLLPPGILILAGFAGVALLRARPRAARWLTSFAFISLYVLSTGFFSTFLLQALEFPYADPTADPRGEAIVILGGGSYRGAPEYGGDTVSAETLERVRYAALLHQRVRKPILVSAGNPAGNRTSEAQQMSDALRQFGTTATWLENGSANTFENARFTRRVLEKAGVKTIYLVTHATHMRRAQEAFERSGLTVIPAATRFHESQSLRLLDFVPNAYALRNSFEFFHEVVGIVWYRLKFALAKQEKP